MFHHVLPSSRLFRCLVFAVAAGALPTLPGCAALLTVGDVPDPAVYRGTALNARILHHSVECQPRNGEDYSCAYSDALWPLSLLDFIPSLVMDTVLLPITGIQSLLHTDEKDQTTEELIEQIRQYPPINPPPPPHPPHSA